MFSISLKDNEKLIKIYRQTELVLVRPVLEIFALIYIPWTFLIKYDLHIKYRKILLVWTIAIALYAIYRYILWLLNSYVFTNQRLINATYHNIFHKQVIETPLERILNISYQTKGVFQSLFNYGDVVVQIVGLTEALVLKNVRKPSDLKDFIWQIHIQTKPKNGSALPTDLAELQQNIGYQSSSSIKRK